MRKEETKTRQSKRINDIEFDTKKVSILILIITLALLFYHDAPYLISFN